MLDRDLKVKLVPGIILLIVFGTAGVGGVCAPPVVGQVQEPDRAQSGKLL